MGGFFGVVSTSNCVPDLFYGTDYHSHLGTKRGGLAIEGEVGFRNLIHNIENAQFRSKFDDVIDGLESTKGIGVISDFDDQPLVIGSHLGTYAVITVAKINNAEELAAAASGKGVHFSEMSGRSVNPTELVATLINEKSNFVEGIQNAQEKIDGSCSILLLTEEGIYAAPTGSAGLPSCWGRKTRALRPPWRRARFRTWGSRSSGSSDPARSCC
jgi:amidophosphoribosyltransferase